jgi:LAO/AO transport system kinase
MKLSALELAKGILCGQRNYLAQAITLIESSRMDHIIEAKTLMNTLAKYHTKRNFQLSSTFRLGITGPPGV